MQRKFSEITFSIAEVAKMTRFPGGEHKLFKWLRKYGYLLKNNQPAQLQIDRGWFVLVSKIQENKTVRRSIPVTRITVKGLSGLERVLNRAFPFCPPCESQIN